MATARQKFAEIVAPARELLGVHARILLPLGGAVVVGLVAFVLLIALYVQAVGVTAYRQLAAFATPAENVSLVMVALMLPIVVLFLLASLVWAGQAVQLANAGSSARRISIGGAALVALRRAPRVFVLFVIVVATVLAAIALAPLLTVAGLVGLLLSIRFSWLPRRAVLIAMAVPFGVAVLVLVRWSLAPASVWLADTGIRAALADSAARVRGREVEVGLTLVIAAVVTLLLTEGIVVLVGLLGLGVYADLAGRLIALVLVGPLLFAALAVLYRRGAGEAPPKAPTVNPRAVRHTRTAVAVILAMVVPLLITVNPAPASAAGSDPSSLDLVASTATAVYGTTVTLTATVTTATAATGTVEFFAGAGAGLPDFLGSAPLLGGVATLPVSALPPGTYDLSALFSGDPVYMDALDYGVPLTVTAASTQISYIISPNSTPTSFSPAGTIFTAAVTVASTDSTAVPRGSVLVRPQAGGPSYDSAALVGGAASLSFSLPPGLPAVMFEYVPDAGFQASQIDETLYVSKFVPTVSLDADPLNSALGDTVDLTATVSAGAAPTGDVSFVVTTAVGGTITLGPTTLTDGVATLSTSALPIGVNSIVASYGGNPAVAAANSASLSYAVGPGAVSVSVVSSIPAPQFGATPDLSITVSSAVPGVGTPGGFVALRLDGLLVDTYELNAAGAFTVSDVEVGDAGLRHFTVDYLGDATFRVGTGSLDLTVSKITTATTLFAPSGGFYGDDLNFTGTVSTAFGPNPTGTVQLFVGGHHVDDGDLVNGAFDITTNLAPAAPAGQDVWIVYPDDANHVGSESPRPVIEVDTVTVDPVLTVTPAVFGVGSTVTVTATFDEYGAGPAGSGVEVVFTDGVGAPKNVTVAGSTATTTFVITTTNTWINAHYEGNGNYEPSDAAPLLLTGTQVPVTVAMSAPGPRVYGEVFTLSATVVLDGGAPAIGNVAFAVGSMAALSPTAPVVGGVATLQVCAGDALGCPSGMPLLGTTNSTITASYAATSISLAGASTPVTYTMTDAPTTTTLVVNPTTVRPNSGLIYFTATVASVGSSAVPRGTIVFEATTAGGSPLSLGSVALDASGVADLTTTLGGGFTYPRDGITASFVASTGEGVDPYVEFPFVASSSSVPFTVDRYDLSLTVAVTGPTSATPVVGLPATVTVAFYPEAGASDDFTEPVTVTTDTGASCQATAAPGSEVASCQLAWPTAGSHTVTATYPGDAAVEPGTSGPSPVATTKGTPTLSPSLTTSPVIALTDATVHWSRFSATATGTVTVVTGGVTWCAAVPLADQSCTGQFPLSSATGSIVTVEVTYSGDVNWDTRTETTGAIVKRCVPLDVTSADPSLGTVTIDTPSNCPGGQYLSGTLVTVSAHPIAPNVFVDWQKLGGLNFVHDSYLSTISFVASADFMTWAHRAIFQSACYPVTSAVTGHGGMSVYPATNCTAFGGGPGYLPGTVIAVYPDTLYNPNYDEHDAFYSFGTVTGGTVKKDSSARPYLSVAVNGPLTIPVKFGPQCRAVSVVFDPAMTGDAATVATSENCESPFGNGFLRYTDVDVRAVSGDPTLAIVGWKLDGVVKPDWGNSSEQTFLVESVKPVLTVQLVHCYTLDLKVDGAQDARSREVGTADVDVKPNCPDGTDRYLGGTTVTITPEVLVDGGAFNGWDLVRIPGVKPAGGTGKLTAQANILTMTADVTVKAGFVFKDTCSSIQVIDNIFGNTRVVTLDDDGCGEGQYFDLQKQTALRDGAPQESFWHDSDRSDVFAHINPDIPLDVFLSVRGDTGTCFDGVRPTGPTEDPDAWTTYGPLTGDVDCAVGGPIQIQVDTCQTVKSTVSFIAEADPSGKVYPRNWFPGTFYLPNADGSVGAFDQSTFDWMVTSNVYVDNGVVKLADLGDDPCTRSGANTYTAGRNLAVYGLGLTSGFEVAGWDGLDPDGRVEGNPVLIETDASGPVFPVNPVFSVSCSTLLLGEGISVIDGARCPGSSADENLFVTGTAVQVRAAQHIGDRILYGFKSGVVGGQIVEEPETERLIGFVLMDVDGKVVTGDYPTDREAIGRAIVQGLKISAGILAIVAPIVLGLLFPPAGIFFAFLGAAAGIVNLIPHGAEVAGVLDLINPTKITTCAARWGFSNTGNPTGGLNAGGIGSTAWTGFKVYQGKDVITQNIGKFGIGGSVLGTATGLYEAGIHHAELGPQSVEELAGTSTMTGCLDDQWRITGSNLTGN